MKLATILAEGLRRVLPDKFSVSGPSESLDEHGEPTGLYCITVGITFYSQIIVHKTEDELIESLTQEGVVNIVDHRAKMMCLDLIEHMEVKLEQLKGAVGK